MKYDIITIGGMNCDLFILGKKSEKKHNNHLDLCFHEGQKVLVDNIHLTTGGGALNSAIAFSRLGLSTASISCLGKDENAQTILKDLKKENIEFLGKQKTGITGCSIILTGKQDRTILVYKGMNDYLDIKDIQLSKINSLWLYCSTLHGKSFETGKKLVSYAKSKGIKVAANLSQYTASLGINRLSSFLKNLDLLILNREEAELLSQKKDLSQISKTILSYLQGILIITDGANNVHAFNNTKHIIHIIKNQHPKNATGAGDAFASGVIYALIKNKDLKTALIFGTKEANSVLQKTGAHTGLLRKIS